MFKNSFSSHTNDSFIIKSAVEVEKQVQNPEYFENKLQTMVLVRVGKLVKSYCIRHSGAFIKYYNESKVQPEASEGWIRVNNKLIFAEVLSH